MKKAISFLVFVLFALSVQAANKVDVIYFHNTRRCTTCMEVENQTKTIVQQHFAKQVSEKSVQFASYNLEEKSTKQLARKYKVGGQSLIVVSNSKQIDLTDKAFMYAVSSPQKWTEILKNAINSLL